MIKDRVIQKRIKGKVLAMAMTAVMASFFVPLRVEAAALELGDKTRGYLEFSAEGYRYTITGEEAFTPCDKGEDGCTHEIKTSNGTATAGIAVTGGTHNIILNGVDIDTTQTDATRMSAMSVSPNATANVFLKGSNKLVSASTYAGIEVPTNATLSIQTHKDDKDASLYAKSDYGGAGIGGAGEKDPSAGNIRIYNGNITAIGGSGGAGIGGAGSGSAGTIIIDDGEIKAIGGSGENVANSEKHIGAPGIGAGNDYQGDEFAKALGDITINGGDVIAWGGKGVANAAGQQAEGIAAGKLSSKEGGTAVVITNGFRGNMEDENFNGLRWTAKEDGTDTDGSAKIVRGTACTVYGDVTLPESMKNGLQTGETLLIPPNCSITIPTDWAEWVCWGTIKGEGNGKIVNADRIREERGGFVDVADENLEVILEAKDFNVNTGLIFKGEPFADTEVYSINDEREGANKKIYRINTDGWTHKYNFGVNGTVTDEVKNAGKYTLIYSKPNCPTISIGFEVAQCDIGKCTVAPIEPVPYTGVAYSHKEIKPYMTLGTYELVSNDYSANFEDKKNTNAGEAKFEISGAGNFTGKRELTYAIQKASITNTDDNKITDVTLLVSSGGVFTGGNYDGSVHKPDSQSVTLSTLKTADKILTKGNDYIVEYYRKDKKLDDTKVDDFKDAGEITVRIIGTGNFDGTVDAKYMINPIKLPVQSVVAESRKYNGTNEVNIKEITVDEASKEILDSDKGKVQADAKKLIGIISGGQAAFL